MFRLAQGARGFTGFRGQDIMMDVSIVVNDGTVEKRQSVAEHDQITSHISSA
jgi:hypothetical protein